MTRPSLQVNVLLLFATILSGYRRGTSVNDNENKADSGDSVPRYVGVWGVFDEKFSWPTRLVFALVHQGRFELVSWHTCSQKEVTKGERRHQPPLLQVLVIHVVSCSSGLYTVAYDMSLSHKVGGSIPSPPTSPRHGRRLSVARFVFLPAWAMVTRLTCFIVPFSLAFAVVEGLDFLPA